MWFGGGIDTEQGQSREPEIDPLEYAHMIFHKGARVIQWKKTSFSTNGAGTTRRPRAKK